MWYQPAGYASRPPGHFVCAWARRKATTASHDDDASVYRARSKMNSAETWSDGCRLSGGRDNKADLRYRMPIVVYYTPTGIPPRTSFIGPDLPCSAIFATSVNNVMFLSVCLCLSPQDNSRSCRRVVTKFIWGMGYVISSNWLDSAGDAVHDANRWIFWNEFYHCEIGTVQRILWTRLFAVNIESEN